MSKSKTDYRGQPPAPKALRANQYVTYSRWVGLLHPDDQLTEPQFRAKSRKGTWPPYRRFGPSQKDKAFWLKRDIARFIRAVYEATHPELVKAAEGLGYVSGNAPLPKAPPIITRKNAVRHDR